MEIIGRDKITQSGDKTIAKIDNRQANKNSHWYQTWWGILLLTIVGGIIVGLFLYFTGTN